jgi:hypothetical protein
LFNQSINRLSNQSVNCETNLIFFCCDNFVTSAAAHRDSSVSLDPNTIARDKRSRTVSRVNITTDKALQGARMAVQWCRYALPSPPLPQSLADKLVMLWSLATLLTVRSANLAFINQEAQDGARTTSLEQTRDLLSTLSTLFLSYCLQGERGGFFQKLTQKSVFSVEASLLLRCYGTLLHAVLVAVNDLCGIPATAQQQKERAQLVEKLVEFKKLKTYYPWLTLIDLVLAANVRMNLGAAFELVRECVDKGLRIVTPNLTLCSPLLCDEFQ